MRRQVVLCVVYGDHLIVKRQQEKQTPTNSIAKNVELGGTVLKALGHDSFNEKGIKRVGNVTGFSLVPHSR